MHRLLPPFLILAVLWAASVAAPSAAQRSASIPDGVQQALDRLAAGDTAAAIERLRHTDLEAAAQPRWFALLGRLYRERGTIESRRRSQEVLERAVQLYPDDAGVALEMGLTSFEQTFYPDAERFLTRALERDPTLCVARYKLGVIHYERWKLRVNSYHDEAEEARVLLARALECDPGNTDAAARYTKLTYALDEPHQALQAAHAFAARFPEAPDFPLMAGAIAHENGMDAMADSAFAVALALMPADEAAAYTGIGENVLGYDALDEFEDAPETDHPLMERAYWIGVDPDPTTSVNPFHLEHMYRTFCADLFYSHASVTRAWSHPQTRGWETERGEVFIRLGPPDEISASHGGDRIEVWRYHVGEHSMTFTFADYTGNGNLSIPAKMSEPLAASRYMDQVVQPDTGIVYVNGVLDAVAFLDDEFNCSVYTLQHANADSMLNNIDLASTHRFVLRTRFFDEDWNVESDDRQVIPVHDMAVVPASAYRLFDVVRRHQLPFGRYHVASTLEDEAGTVKAVQRGECDASHLARTGVVTSDILFLRDGSPGAALARGGELLTPNPWRAYSRSQRLGVYFEVYNLTAAGGQSHYRVTYEIREDPTEAPGAWERMGRFVGRIVGRDGRPAVAQSFDRVGTGFRAAERMAIDISVLDPGRYRLWLTVADTGSGDRYETSRTFTITGPEVEVATP